MKKIILLSTFIVCFISPILLTAGPVSQDKAGIVAKNYYYSQTGIKQENIEFESILSESKNGEVFYYIFNIKDNKGFVIVSAEDYYYPIIGYSDEGTYIQTDMPYNIRGWMNHYINDINYVRENSINQSNDIELQWESYDQEFEEFEILADKSKAVEPMVDDILWDQGAGWNAFCPEDAGGSGGHVWAGCVATAMGIVMKYWNYPIHGTGTHSYYASGYGTQSADFGNSTYFWANMHNTTANQFSAQLLYHLGVSVNMGYGADGSGAFSFDVPGALETYFQYDTDASYVEKSSYSQTDWINLLKAQIDIGRPVYYSGRDIDNGGHAFVCSGYTDTDLFHFNFGWSGSNNGYYSVTDVGGFSYSQAAVINIYPENSNVYPESPTNLNAVLNTGNFEEFVVDLSWEAPAVKEISNYIIYRDLTQIANINSTNLTYTDNSTVPGNYVYSVSAEYSTGEESLTTQDNLVGLFNITIKAVDPDNGNNITMAEVTFNNETKTTSFIGAVFTFVPFGGNYYFNITHTGYPETHGYIDVMQNLTVNVPMNGNVDIETLTQDNISLFPNPADEDLYIEFGHVKKIEYELIDIMGKVKLSDGYEGDKLHINVENLPSGYYILKLYERNTNVTLPIIVK